MKRDVAPSEPTSPLETALLSVREAGRRVGDRWIWRGLTFALDEGARLGLTGPSGSGKTLLLRALAGLDALDEGAVTFRGRSLADWSMPDYRAHVTYLAQAPALMEGTVEHALRSVFAFSVHQAKAYDPAWVRDHLALLGRDDGFLRRETRLLSGGEQQMTAFLRALQLGPDVLLLDEPTASLDERSTRRIEDLVAAWLDEAPGRAAVWTSHQPEQIDRMTTRRIDLA